MSVSAQPITLLRVPDILRFYGTGKSQFHQDVRDGLVSKPIKPSYRVACWPEHELVLIQRARVAGKTPEQIKELVKELEAARKFTA